MSINYEVKFFADSFKNTDQNTSWLLSTVDTILKETNPKSGSDSFGKIGAESFYIYLVDIDDKHIQGYLNDLLSGTLDQQAHLLGLNKNSDAFGIFFFLSKSRSYTVFSDRSNPDHGVMKDRSNPDHGVMKDSEFYIRIFKSYQLGKFVYYEWEIALEELRTQLRRLAYQHAKLEPSKQHPRPKGILALLKDIKDDAIQLFNIANQEKVEGLFNTGTEDHYTVDPTVLRESLALFLKTLGILYQIGRRPPHETDISTQKLEWLHGYGGSFDLKERIDRELKNPETSDAARLKEMLIKLRTYEIYRDLAQWLASGARHWVEKLKELKILIIDENIEENLSFAHKKDPEGYLFLERLKRIYQAFRPQTISVDHISSSGLGNLLKSLWDKDNKRAFERLESFGDGPIATDLQSYHLILVEVEFIGPTIVQKLAAYFDQNKDATKFRPTIIVLSRKKNLGHMQQCLSLGAEAYVEKERIYALPARIAQARIARKLVEPRGRKSNFRSLYQLQPHKIAKLQDELVLGHSWDGLNRKWLRNLPKADLHTHLGTCITLPTIEALSFNTSGYLLYNIRRPGESETEDRIENLSLENLKEIVERICQVIIWAGVLNKVGVLITHPPAYLLWVAVNSILQMEGGYDESDAHENKLPDKDIYDALIKRLIRADRQITSFEVCSLLVSAICLTGGTSSDTSMFPSQMPSHSEKDYLEPVKDYLEPVKERITQRWRYLDALHKWANEDDNQLEHPTSNNKEGLIQRKWLTSLFESIENHCQVITGQGWSRGFTMNWSGKNFAPPYPWQQCFDMVTKRTEKTVESFHQYFQNALVKLQRGSARLGNGEQWREANFTEAKRMLLGMRWPPSPMEFRMPSLTEFVKIPEPPETQDQNLLRYLWGAGLLGADHLQYPENILLTGKDIVEQAVNDNIAYSEIRCATTGYCAGGMSPEHVTDLLCYSFDLATAYYAIREKRRWVRINILLSAKRNKSEEDFREVVSLLTHYLHRVERKAYEREEFGVNNLHQIAPRWWKPSRVVGFDLSGDEAINLYKAEDIMKPLFKLSASITIHAGEAATAENIWNAVYHFGARRIGHGLRLRENRRLLNYCINEGVCIEMCPTSNQFTNGFVEVDKPKDYDGSWREHYPLRYYLEEGLDVSINTDNRQLHSGKTLTDEYMCAALMSGGLTRWEVLKLIKAGFKHSFLLKSDVEALLTGIEDEVYNFVIDTRFENI